MSFSLAPWLARASPKNPGPDPAAAGSDPEERFGNPRRLGARVTLPQSPLLPNAGKTSPLAVAAGPVPEPKTAPGHRPETLKITGPNVAAIAASGRARWKIENQKNHPLKTKDDHLKPNFGHGKNCA